MTSTELSEHSEMQLLLRWAAMTLTPTERYAIETWLAGETLKDAAREYRRVGRGGIWMAKQSGLRKMRRRLQQAGITSARMLTGGAT
jgi:hypothetical protein